MEIIHVEKKSNFFYEKERYFLSLQTNIEL